MKRCIDCHRPLARGPQQGAQKRCAACALAAQDHANIWFGQLRDGKRVVPVDCWCRRTSVWVHWTDVQLGLTGTCGLTTCRRAA